MKTAPKRPAMDLTQGAITKQLFLYAVPIFFSSLLQMLYNAADRMVVGQFSGPIALAAVGSTGYPTSLLISFVFGLATGANVIIANFRGARKPDDMRKAMHTSMALSVLCGIFLMILGVFLSRPLMVLLETPEDVIDLSTLYMQITFCGTPFSMIYNFGSACLRANGDTRRPMIIVSISGLINVILNLFFVIVLHMSVDGVALATVLSQVVSALWVCIILFNPRDDYRLQWKELKLYRGITGRIIHAGLPMGINTSLQNFAGLFLQGATNSFGSAVMAGSSAADSVTGILATVPSTMFHSCVSFSGQCYGAKKYDRIDKLLVRSIGLGTSITALLAILCTLFPQLCLSLYTTDPASIAAGIPKLIIVAWGYVAFSVCQSALGILRGIGKSFGPTLVSVFCFTVMRLLWIWFIFPLYPTPSMLFMCILVSFVFNAAGEICYYLACRKKILQTEDIPKEAAL